MEITEVNKNGIVARIDGNTAEVMVACKGDECSGCKAALLCSTNKDAVRLKVAIPDGMNLKLGDDVKLIGRLRGWFGGWMLLAGLPCLLVLAGIGVGYKAGMGDVTMGLICIGLVAVYYSVLWALKGKADKRVEWSISG